jgi:hypothetical protein
VRACRPRKQPAIGLPHTARPCVLRSSSCRQVQLWRGCLCIDVASHAAAAHLLPLTSSRSPPPAGH